MLCKFGIDVPCIHRLYNHVVFPECLFANLSTHLECNELIFEKNLLKDEESDEYISIEWFGIHFLTEIIHHYSKFKNKEKIKEYINNTLCFELEWFILELNILMIRK